jgi:Zn-dependent peptidase ImmA (M78 family)/transcriptional regulator with XRE-family HTH domain
MNRIKQLRLALGLSLDGLARAMGGLVSKQALSKYEQGASRPTPAVATRLARALRVKAVQLWTPPQLRVQFIAYRKRPGLGRKKLAQIEASCARRFEQQLRLQERCLGQVKLDLPIQTLPVTNPQEAEMAARHFRRQWGLGEAPIANLTATLEAHAIHVFSIPADPEFDGLSGVARDSAGTPQGAAIIVRQGVPGDRQRFSLVHELAHLALKLNQGTNQEKLASRFASAFLVPESALRQELGPARANLSMGELLILKRRFGVSVHMLIRRTFELGIISRPTFQSLRTLLTDLDWLIKEPERIEPEQPQWAKQTALRGVAEGRILHDEASELAGEPIQAELSAGILRRRAFLRLPLAERRRLLKTQAAHLTNDADADAWRALDGEAFS